ncbi:MAG: exodeoxyribonuclease VII small subunit [Firmicutes bacterium]|nr:exodeoxyribonuclease VII small subunit [Bacillota bacterium]
MAKKEQNFEESMQRLEEIVRRLESGEEPLDAALKLFEEGTKLARACEKTLKNAEQKIALLTAEPAAGKEAENE